MNLTKKYIVLSLALILLVSLSLLIAKYTIYNAFIFIAMLWFIVCLITVIISKSNMRLWALYTASVILAFGLLEAYWSGWLPVKNREYITGSITQAGYYYKPHSILGYGPEKGIQATAQKHYGNELIYNVTYSIGTDGLRVGSYLADDSSPGVLFFGGSFTFGAGVENDETLPYRFEEMSNGKFKSFNFGFHGYGPHQMLAILENGLEREIVGQNTPRYAIYQALPAHVARCTGRTSWDVFGPRYTLDSDGEVHHAGQFYKSLMNKVMLLISRSTVLSRIRLALQREDSNDLKLFFGIIRKAQDIFKERYGGEFLVLLWDQNDNPAYQEILAGLKRYGMTVIEIEEILQDFKENKQKYLIKIPVEYHPNEVAYDLIADYLLTLLRDFS